MKEILSSKLVLVLIILMILSWITAGVLYFTDFGLPPVAKTAFPSTLPSTTPTFILAPFDYMIKAVAQNEVIVEGEREEMVVVPDDPKVRIFKGLPPNTLAVSFTDLAVNQKVKIETMLGMAANVYIVE